MFSMRPERLDPVGDPVTGVQVRHRVAARPGQQVALVAAQVNAGAIDDARTHPQAVQRLHIDPRAQAVRRNAGDGVPRRDGDFAVLRHRMVLRAHLEGRLEGGLDVTVVEEPVEAAAIAGEGQVETLAPGLGDVLEVAARQAHPGADEDDVVAVGRPVGARAPVERGEAAQPFARHAAAQAGLEGARRHLLQRRVGDEGVGQVARVVRVGAGQFRRRRRAAALAEAAEQRDRRRQAGKSRTPRRWRG